MKKIIATVLAMVMALALCSTAFAATDTWVIYQVKADGTVTAYAGTADATYTGAVTKHDAKDSGDTKNVEYWTYETSTAYYVACDKDDATDASGTYYVVCKNGKTYDMASYKNYVKYVGNNDDGTKYTETVTAKDETDKDASCTVDHYLKDGYVNDDGDFFVQDDEGSIKARISGTNKIVKLTDKTSSDVVYASHILGKATKNSDKGYYEATCLVCGAKVALTDSYDVLKANSIAKKDTYKYVASDAEAVADDNDKKGAYKFAVGTEFAGSYEFAWDLTSGSKTDTTTDGKTSPKTFDAGVAMYVGMALASVTGSAVVIGKKKEF